MSPARRGERATRARRGGATHEVEVEVVELERVVQRMAVDDEREFAASSFAGRRGGGIRRRGGRFARFDCGQAFLDLLARRARRVFVDYHKVHAFVEERTSKADVDRRLLLISG